MIIKRNARQRMDGLDLLRGLPDRSAALVHLDFQYRSVMDKQQYGNEGDRMAGRAELPQMDETMIKAFVAESFRVLRSSGHALIWLDKFMLFEGSWHRWLPEITPVRLVDGILWDKDRISMGRRSRYCFEALAILQKGPVRAADVWTDHSMRDVFRMKADRARHPHAKPVQLLQRIIQACTKPNDIIVDPCAGSYTTLDACRASGRTFIGSDILS